MHNCLQGWCAKNCTSTNSKKHTATTKYQLIQFFKTHLMPNLKYMHYNKFLKFLSIQFCTVLFPLAQQSELSRTKTSILQFLISFALSSTSPFMLYSVQLNFPFIKINTFQMLSCSFTCFLSVYICTIQHHNNTTTSNIPFFILAHLSAVLLFFNECLSTCIAVLLIISL